MALRVWWDESDIDLEEAIEGCPSLFTKGYDAVPVCYRITLEDIGIKEEEISRLYKLLENKIPGDLYIKLK